MSGPAILDHAAVLTRSVDQAAASLARFHLPAGPVEEFPGEGTREQYWGGEDLDGRLLLLEALDSTSDGPYARALRKRGPGLHHVALRVPALEPYLAGLEGWLLHRVSLGTVAGSRTAWLARPGIEVLVEVQESTLAAQDADPVLTAVEVPCASGLAHLVAQLAVPTLQPAAPGRARLHLGSEVVALPLD